MKRYNKFASLILGVNVLISSTYAADIHVSPRGDDEGEGTAVSPITSLHTAQKRIRQIKKEGMPQEGITVYLHGGTYRLEEPLVLTPEDSGEKDRPVFWKAFAGENPVISGGIPVTGWTEHENGIWKAKLVREKKLRQLYVNDIPATMATYGKALIPLGWRGTYVVTGNEPWAGDGAECHAGFGFNSDDLPAIERPQDLELQQRRTWTIQRVSVSSLNENGDENGERLGFFTRNPFSSTFSCSEIGRLYCGHRKQNNNILC